jgi:hypothetical protein
VRRSLGSADTAAATFLHLNRNRDSNDIFGLGSPPPNERRMSQLLVADSAGVKGRVAHAKCCLGGGNTETSTSD